METGDLNFLADVLLCTEETAQRKVAERHHHCSLLVRALQSSAVVLLGLDGIHIWGIVSHAGLHSTANSRLCSGTKPSFHCEYPCLHFVSQKLMILGQRDLELRDELVLGGFYIVGLLF